MAKILITGKSGFIGQNLCAQLAADYKIYAPVSSELDLLDETKTEKYIKENSFDIIIHTATWNATVVSPKDTSKVLKNNLRMFFNIARMNKFYGKMLYLGSGAEFNSRYYISMMKEEYFDSHIPEDDYGLSKYIMSKYAFGSENIYNLRLFGVFGKYEDWRIRFISNACCKAVFDMPITIKQNRIMDYLYIDDFVKIIRWFIENKPSENIYNICSSKPVSLLSLAETVLYCTGKQLPVKITKEGFAKEYSGDNSKMVFKTGFQEFTDINVAVGELYEWYSENKNIIDENLLL